MKGEEAKHWGRKLAAFDSGMISLEEDAETLDWRIVVDTPLGSFWTASVDGAREAVEAMHERFPDIDVDEVGKEFDLIDSTNDPLRILAMKIRATLL